MNMRMYENECMREYIKYTIIGLYMLPLLFLHILKLFIIICL